MIGFRGDHDHDDAGDLLLGRCVLASLSTSSSVLLTIRPSLLVETKLEVVDHCR